MNNQNNKSLFQKDLMSEALVQSFVKLNPKTMFLNPVMFTVEIGAFVMLIVKQTTLLPPMVKLSKVLPQLTKVQLREKVLL